MRDTMLCQMQSAAVSTSTRRPARQQDTSKKVAGMTTERGQAHGTCSRCRSRSRSICFMASSLRRFCASRACPCATPPCQSSAVRDTRAAWNGQVTAQGMTGEGRVGERDACSIAWYEVSFTEKNMGPWSASQWGSTTLTHCMYSLEVSTSSWYTT